MASAMRLIGTLSSGLLNRGFNRCNFIMGTGKAVNLKISGKCVVMQYISGGKRFLFSETYFGIDGYKRQRAFVSRQFEGTENAFRTKVLEYTNKEEGMIFTDDLKAMLYLMEDNPEDIDLLLKMLRKYHLQNKKLGMGTFVFGPVVMRTFYHLQNPDSALAVFNDPLLEGFFNETSSFLILLDLLFNNERYDDMIAVHRTIGEKYSNHEQFAKSSMTLIMAGCYKKNDRESLDYAMKIWKDSKGVDFHPSRRSCAFLSALAISQGSPEIALEVLSGVLYMAEYMSIRSLKVAALADLDRVEDIAPYFRTVLSEKSRIRGNQFFFRETLCKVQAAVTRANLDENSELVKLFRLIEADFVYNMSLDAFLCQTIDRLPPQVNERSDSTRKFGERARAPARFETHY